MDAGLRLWVGDRSRKIETLERSLIYLKLHVVLLKIVELTEIALDFVSIRLVRTLGALSEWRWERAENPSQDAGSMLD